MNRTKRLLLVVIVVVLFRERYNLGILLRYLWVRMYEAHTGIQPGRPLAEVVR